MPHDLVVNIKSPDAEYDIYIGRGHKGQPLEKHPKRPWGNPFRLGQDGDRTAVVAKYRHWLLMRPYLVDAAREELNGKRLGCWCAPEACHGDVLAVIAATVPVPHEKSKSTCKGDCGGGCHDCTLFSCEHCGGIEGGMTSECPRTRLTMEQINQVYAGNLNFLCGEWVDGSIRDPRFGYKEPGGRDMPCWCGKVY